MAKKEVKKICIECAKYINAKKDKYVQVSTYNRENLKDDHCYFHFACWINYFNTRVELKARENICAIQEQALKVFENPMIKSLLSQIQGSDLALNMASIPLLQGVVPKELVVKKIQNGRKKRSGKKSASKMH